MPRLTAKQSNHLMTLRLEQTHVNDHEMRAFLRAFESGLHHTADQYTRAEIAGLIKTLTELTDLRGRQ